MGAPRHPVNGPSAVVHMSRGRAQKDFQVGYGGAPLTLLRCVGRGISRAAEHVHLY